MQAGGEMGGQWPEPRAGPKSGPRQGHAAMWMTMIMIMIPNDVYDVNVCNDNAMTLSFMTLYPAPAASEYDCR